MLESINSLSMLNMRMTLTFKARIMILSVLGLAVPGKSL